MTVPRITRDVYYQATLEGTTTPSDGLYPLAEEHFYTTTTELDRAINTDLEYNGLDFWIIWTNPLIPQTAAARWILTGTLTGGCLLPNIDNQDARPGDIVLQVPVETLWDGSASDSQLTPGDSRPGARYTNRLHPSYIAILLRDHWGTPTPKTFTVPRGKATIDVRTLAYTSFTTGVTVTQDIDTPVVPWEIVQDPASGAAQGVWLVRSNSEGQPGEHHWKLSYAVANPGDTIEQRWDDPDEPPPVIPADTQGV